MVESGGFADLICEEASSLELTTSPTRTITLVRHWSKNFRDDCLSSFIAGALSSFSRCSFNFRSASYFETSASTLAFMILSSSEVSSWTRSWGMPAYSLSIDVNIGAMARNYIGIKARSDGLAHGSRSAGDEESELSPLVLIKQGIQGLSLALLGFRLSSHLRLVFVDHLSLTVLVVVGSMKSKLNAQPESISRDSCCFKAVRI